MGLIRRVLPWLLAVAAIGVLVAVFVPPWLAQARAPQVVVPSGELATAVAAWADLPVRGRAPMTGYDRALFGDGWADLDQDGCSTREEVLARDLVDLTLDGCTVLAGTLPDPYSGLDVDFVRGEDSDVVQIDHVVALADAWQKGAQQWTAARREQFANDPANLLAVDGALNQEKGAGDAATWLPPSKGYRCAYVIRQVLVKAEYGLWVTQAEHDAMGRWLDSCVPAR